MGLVDSSEDPSILLELGTCREIVALECWVSNSLGSSSSSSKLFSTVKANIQNVKTVSDLLTKVSSECGEED